MPAKGLFDSLVRVFGSRGSPTAEDKTKDQEDSAKISIGFGGDIPISPPIFCAISIGAGLAAPRLTGIDGSLFRYLVPGPYYVPVRVVASAFTLISAAKLKRECSKAFDKVDTNPNFQPVASVVDTGPYKYLRNPMYISVFGIPALIGFATDNFWVAFGSNFAFWLYLQFVVIPAEEKYLLKQLGNSYEKYCASVKRWGFF